MKLYEAKETEFPEPEQFRELERVVLLKVIDRKWMDHIDDMDQLRQGIGLTGIRTEIRWLSTRWQDLTCLTI